MRCLAPEKSVRPTQRQSTPLSNIYLVSRQLLTVGGGRKAANDRWTLFALPTSAQQSCLRADAPADKDQILREGGSEMPYSRMQAKKEDPEQASISSVLPPADLKTVADVGVVGCGPAGLALAAALASRGVSVVLVGHDAPFVNNYGVWLDEFKELELEHTLDATWQDALCYFREGEMVQVGRAYGRVCRRRLRTALLERCAAAGVKYIAGEVEAIQLPPDNSSENESQKDNLKPNSWPCTKLVVINKSDAAVPEGEQDMRVMVECRLCTLASGVAAGRFLTYESGAPSVAAQTAYGIEADVEGYEAAYDPTHMLFMDYRRHHSGLWPKSAVVQQNGRHPNGNDGQWGPSNEVPSFLYAMPLANGRVFLEETCLVAKPPLPFSVLRRRLTRRCEALGLKISKVHEEEWSYIPTGGPLPMAEQPLTAFGAAANLVHPATGYSIARSLREAPAMASSIQRALETSSSPCEASKMVWQALWTPEKRRQASFHVFGMELLCRLNLQSTSDFFTTFFALPPFFWRGFLGSKLSSVDLLGFALTTFALAPTNIKSQLVMHLATHPAGKYMIDEYLGKRSGINTVDTESGPQSRGSQEGTTGSNIYYG